MFKPKTAFSGFSVNDLAKAKAFYTQTLGLQVVEEGVWATASFAWRRHSFCVPKRRPSASHVHFAGLCG